jgi:hypothetical protein
MPISNDNPARPKKTGASLLRALVACMVLLLSTVAVAGCAGPLRTAGQPFVEAGETIRDGFASAGRDRELPFFFDERSQEIDERLGR